MATSPTPEQIDALMDSDSDIGLVMWRKFIHTVVSYKSTYYSENRSWADDMKQLKADAKVGNPEALELLGKWAAWRMKVRLQE